MIRPKKNEPSTGPKENDPCFCCPIVSPWTYGRGPWENEQETVQQLTAIFLKPGEGLGQPSQEEGAQKIERVVFPLARPRGPRQNDPPQK